MLGVPSIVSGRSVPSGDEDLPPEAAPGAIESMMYTYGYTPEAVDKDQKHSKNVATCVYIHVYIYIYIYIYTYTYIFIFILPYIEREQY